MMTRTLYRATGGGCIENGSLESEEQAKKRYKEVPRTWIDQGLLRPKDSAKMRKHKTDQNKDSRTRHINQESKTRHRSSIIYIFTQRSRAGGPLSSQIQWNLGGSGSRFIAGAGDIKRSWSFRTRPKQNSRRY